MWIVKLGGSLHARPDLGRWLDLLATAPGPPRILVPGGGPFADAVRDLQSSLRFDDLAAHRMAILAMQQYALFLQARAPGLALLETEAELRAARAGIWLPWRLAGREPALPASWELTSDAIAGWLAGLVLVKAAPLPTGSAPVAELAALGLVDAWLGRMAPPQLADGLWAVSPDGLGRLLAGDASGACRLLPDRPAA